ncbi:MAG: response regulator [Aggregatilineales bacterium]
MRILYVEDNQANVYLVKRVALGHEVINYIDGEEALAKITRHDPHLILMDIQLAGPMTGLDVVRTLRERGIETPIIAVTAYAMVGDRERCIAAGCDDYLAKPLPITRLIGLIKKYSELTDAKLAQASTAEIQAISEETIDDTSEEAQTAVDAIKAEITEAPQSDITGEALIVDVKEDDAPKDEPPEAVLPEDKTTVEDKTPEPEDDSSTAQK